MENEILKIVGRKKRTISEITLEFYEPSKTDHPIDPNNVVTAAIRRINKKCELYELSWGLMGKGGGRHGRTVWRGKREV